MQRLIPFLYFAAVIWCVVDILRQPRFSQGAAAGLILMVLLLPVLGVMVYLLVRFSRPQAAR
jgi:hypothetical protein